MIGFLIYPHQDELLYSFIARYHVVSCNDYLSETYNELFSYPQYTSNPYYMSRIDALANNLPNEEEFLTDNIFRNHLYLPLVKPFVRTEQYALAEESTRQTNSRIHDYYGFHEDKLFASDELYIKVCPICFKEDIDHNGYAYIHRMHNYIGAKTCYKHHCYLDTLLRNVSFRSEVLDINKLYVPSEVIYPEDHLIEHFNHLNEDVQYILNGGLQSFDKAKIREYIANRIKEKGVFKRLNHNKHKLLPEFLEYYPKAFLEAMESNYSLEDKKIWMMTLLHTDNDVNYIRQLLAIRYLFGSVEAFESYINDYKPFGDHPFPCLNVVCDHYQKDVINEFEESVCKHEHALVGTFTCPHCGYTYTRRTDNNKDRYTANFVKDVGFLWRDKLKEKVVAGETSVKRLSKIMNANEFTIIKTAEMMGFIDLLSTSRSVKYNSIEPERKIDIDAYRQLIIEHIANNPDINRLQLSQQLSKEFNYLKKYDTEWLLNALPEKQTTKGKTRYDDQYWADKQAELLPVITEAIKTL